MRKGWQEFDYTKIWADMQDYSTEEAVELFRKALEPYTKFCFNDGVWDTWPSMEVK